MQIPAGVLGKKFGGKPLMFLALIVNGVLCLTTPTLAKYVSHVLFSSDIVEQVPRAYGSSTAFDSVPPDV